MRDLSYMMLEMMRLIFIIIFLLIGFGVINNFLTIQLFDHSLQEISSAEGNLDNVLFLSQLFGVILIYHVLYRNKLQFTGWSKGKKQQQPVSTQKKRVLLISALICFVIPYIYMAYML